MLYADVDGNIGYQTAGLVPMRRRDWGAAPVPGWTDEFGWRGFIPFDELPSVLNPEKGYIVSANNPITGPGYPHFLGAGFAYGFRARRIVDMIEGDPDGVTVEDAKAMHADTLHLTALEIVPYE